MHILDRAQGDDRLCFLYSGDAFDSSEKGFERFRTLGHDLHQVIEITRQVVAFEDLILRIDKGNEMIGKARLFETDKHQRGELAVHRRRIHDRCILRNNSGRSDLADAVAGGGNGQIDLCADLRYGRSRILLQKPNYLFVDGVHRASSSFPVK